MTAFVAIFVAGTVAGFSGLVWSNRMEDALERAADRAADELENALDERDLEWVRIVARRDVAIRAARNRWADQEIRPVEVFDEPEWAAEYDAETWRLCGEIS